MNQFVEIDLTLRLWLDATVPAESLPTILRDRLAATFGAAVTDVTDPVTVHAVREEAALFGTDGG